MLKVRIARQLSFERASVLLKSVFPLRFSSASCSYLIRRGIILIASRPPAATQGFRDRGLPNSKIKASKPSKNTERTRARKRIRTRTEHGTNEKRGSKNRQNNEPKMLPEGARRARNQGLGASGALLGAMWAQSGCQEHSKWLLRAARGGKTNCWLGPGPPQRRKVDRFQDPGGVPGGLWGGSGVVFLVLFRSRGAGNQRIRQNLENKT